MMLWVLRTASKQAPVCTISFILKNLNNEQNAWKFVKVDGYGAMENPPYVTNLIVNYFNIYMETNGGDASCIHVKNERQNMSIHDMVRAGLL